MLAAQPLSLCLCPHERRVRRRFRASPTAFYSKGCPGPAAAEPQGRADKEQPGMFNGPLVREKL